MRDDVADHLGSPVVDAIDPRDGANSSVAALLTLADGRRVFVKGQLADGQRDELDREAAIAPHLPPSAPRLLARIAVDAWDLLAFDGLPGERALYEHDAADLPLVTAALAELADCAAPAGLLTAWDRWGYYCNRTDRALLTGGTLMHTDPSASNVVISGGRAHLVDWAWPAVGPAWIDPVLWGVRLVSDGRQTPEQAHAWVSKLPAFAEATERQVRAFARAEARSWDDVAEKTDDADIGAVAEAAQTWADFLA